MFSHELTAAITVGEMIIKIQDAATGKPLAGVYVYRDIRTQYVPVPFFPIEVKAVYHPGDYAISNNDGIAIFPRKNISQKRFNEYIATMQLELNYGFNKNFDPNNADAFYNALVDSRQDGDGIYSKNKANDALSLAFVISDVDPKYRYEVVKSEKPRREYVIFRSRFDFKEPYKTIVIKLGNDSLVENGIKTEVTLEQRNLNAQ